MEEIILIIWLLLAVPISILVTDFINPNIKDIPSHFENENENKNENKEK